MTYTLYDASVALAKDALDSLAVVLAKAEAAPNAADLPEARLYADMLPLAFQVHFATDLAQKMAARLSGTEPLTLENDLKTLDAMKARVAEIRDVVAKADRELVDGRAAELVPLATGPNRPVVDVSATAYVNGYGLPNLFFHLTTAYNILRKEGVPLGKLDFLLPFLGKYLPDGGRG